MQGFQEREHTFLDGAWTSRRLCQRKFLICRTVMHGECIRIVFEGLYSYISIGPAMLPPPLPLPLQPSCAPDTIVKELVRACMSMPRPESTDRSPQRR